MQTKPLTSSENNFLDLLNFIADPAVIVNEKGCILLVNSAFEDVTGLSQDNVIGKVFLELSILATESKVILLENLKKRMQGLLVKPYEITFRSKDGEIRHVEVKAKKISYAGRHADLVLFRDVTRRKRNLSKLKEYAESMQMLVEEKIRETEEELRQTEQKLRSIVYGSPIPAFFIGKDHKVVYWNHALEKYSGLKAEDIVGTDQHWKPFYPQKRPCLADLILEEATDKLVQWYSGKFQKSELVEEGYEATDFFPAVGKDGAWLDFTAVAIRDSNGNIIGAMETLEDITERKKAESALQASERNYRAVINAMNDTAWVIGFDGSFIDVNDAAVKVLGYSRGELLSGGIDKIDKHLTKSEVQALIDRLPRVGTQVFETVHTSKDGKEVPVEICSSLMTYHGKKAILSIARDITERKRMQSELAEYSMGLERLVEERTEQLKQTQSKLLKAEKLAAIGELAGMVGHDLRNPLTGIKGAAYYLKTRCAAEIDATGKEMLNTIENAITYSNKIVNDLLEYSCKLSLELTETTPKSLLKNALSSIEVPERIRIIDATKDKPKIKADIERMQKVFANIITNAMDAMPTTGTLTITSYATEGNVEFTFKDKGAGMTKDTLSKLKLGFPLFTTKAKGMGFGLPICKRIIEAHGGKISLESTLGKGTTVTVTIPVDPKPTDASEETWIFNESLLRALPASRKAS